jgi:ion channel-forming bestrophin family protein
MIIRPRPSAFGLLFILRGSILGTVAPRLLAVVVASVAVAVLHHVAPYRFHGVTPAPFAMLGLALSIFLGFRNNACYDRWWEGRHQWGQLIAETRGLLRDTRALLPQDIALQQRIGRRTIAFAEALRDQLRGTSRPAQARPDAILRAQSDEFGALVRQGALTDILYGVFATRLQAMTNIQAACERLRSTPMPFTYTLLLHRTAWLFCLLVPFGLVAELGMATPVVSVILAYAFFGLDALGEELEQPFGLWQNAVPIDALTRIIEIAALESLGETDLPPLLQPVDYILL